MRGVVEVLLLLLLILSVFLLLLKCVLEKLLLGLWGTWRARATVCVGVV